MDEFSLIKEITDSTYQRKELIRGVGDDAAVFRSPHEDIVVAVDSFVEGVHFTKATLASWQIGYRLLAANLSDLAAMGARPLFYLVSIVVPSDVEDSIVMEIFSGMKRLAKRYGIDLIGGDTVSGKELMISLTIIGSVPKGKARYRSDAKAGDVVFVTGSLGGASAGLDLLLGELSMDNTLPAYQTLITCHQQPSPRIDFALALQAIDRLALNDVSDGLANELHELAACSQVAIEVKDEAIPVTAGLECFSEDLQWHWKYFGGEDFELVGTVSRKDFASLKEIGERYQIAVTEIGSVMAHKEQAGKVYVQKQGIRKPLQKKGYVHRSRDDHGKI